MDDFKMPKLKDLDKKVKKQVDKLKDAEANPIVDKHKIIDAHKKIIYDLKAEIDFFLNLEKVKETIVAQKKIVRHSGMLKVIDIENLRRAQKLKAAPDPDAIKKLLEELEPERPEHEIDHFTKKCLDDMEGIEEKAKNVKDEGKRLKEEAEQLNNRIAHISYFHVSFLQILDDQWQCVDNMQCDVQLALINLVEKHQAGEPLDGADLTEANNLFEKDMRMLLLKMNTEIRIYNKWAKSSKHVHVFVSDLKSISSEIKVGEEKIKSQREELFETLKEEIIKGKPALMKQMLTRDDLNEMQNLGLITEDQEKKLNNELAKHVDVGTAKSLIAETKERKTVAPEGKHEELLNRVENKIK